MKEASSSRHTDTDTGTDTDRNTDTGTQTQDRQKHRHRHRPLASALSATHGCSAGHVEDEAHTGDFWNETQEAESEGGIKFLLLVLQRNQLECRPAPNNTSNTSNTSNTANSTNAITIDTITSSQQPQLCDVRRT